MKKVLFLLLAAFLMASCASFDSGCPSYGGTNKMTKYGFKAQNKYNKKRI